VDSDKTPSLARVTKKIIDDPAKKAKYTKVLCAYVGGKEVYEKDKADALETGVKPLVGGPIVAKMFKTIPIQPTTLSHHAKNRARLLWSARGNPRASIIPCSSAGELSNNIIQKVLASGRDWSGTVVYGRVRALRDPAPPAR
jgi:hypothetical protein